MNEKVSTIETNSSAANEDGPTDAQLLARFIEQRDQAAFEKLLFTHGPMVFGVCRRILPRFHDAEDAFQATFLSLARNANRIGRRELVANWLYIVARRVAIKLKRNASKRRQVELQLEHQMSKISESNLDQDELWTDLAPVLDREIGCLADDLRVAVILCDVEGKTRKEAARQLGCPEATVSTRLMKARSLLAQRLKRQGVVLTATTLAVLLSQNAASAAVPASLLATTLQTAGVVAAGQAVSAGIASPHVIALSKGTLNSISFVSLKTVMATFVALATAGLGYQLQQEKQPEVPQAVGVVNGLLLNGQFGLPLAVQTALEENAAQLAPITVSYTEQLKSRLPEQETFERLKTAKYRSPQRMFQSVSNREIWQEPKFYTFSKGINGSYSDDKGYTEALQERECSFDGNILYQGHHWVNPTKTNGYLVKERRIPYYTFGSSYFNEGFTGLSFPPFGAERESGMRSESSVLGSLRRGGELISVSESSIEGRPCVRVEMRVENMGKNWADQRDLEQAKQMYSGELYTPGEREQFLENIVAARTLPKTKRIVFYLDPAMNYALRQMEEWYDPETLVYRSLCSNFERLPNRQLWLPRMIEIDYRMFHTAPGVVFVDPFLSRLIQVTELSGDPAPESQFMLDYKDPGTFITDMTGGDIERKTTDQPLVYKVGQTPAETQNNRAAPVLQTNVQLTGELRDTRLAAVKPKSKVNWYLLGNLVAILSILCLITYRRYYGAK